MSPSTDMTGGTSSPGQGPRMRQVCNINNIITQRETICIFVSGHAPGDGKTVNIAWSSSQQPLGDAEYLAAMRTVVTPIIKVGTLSKWIIILTELPFQSYKYYELMFFF